MSIPDHPIETVAEGLEGNPIQAVAQGLEGVEVRSNSL